MNQPIQSRSVETVRKILTAAEAVIGRSGAAGLTMEAVAAEAGISKGGVLHHFRTKESLIAAVVRARLEDYETAYCEERDALGDSAEAALVASIRHMKRLYNDERGFPRALLVAATEHPEALNEFRASLRSRLDAKSAMAGSGAGAALLFATLGLLLTKTLDFVTVSEQELDAICEALEKLAKG
jgi:AcrR family transcriptional regulator